MATLTVIKFATPEGADQAVGVLNDLQKQNLITMIDSAVVTWPQGARKPKTKQNTHPAAIGALGGAFWGMLFGLIFFVPFLGAAIGAGLGALTGAMADVGINDDFIKQSRDKVTEGTSAVFLLTQNAVVDRVAEAFTSLPPYELIASNLSAEEEAKLKDVFAD